MLSAATTTPRRLLILAGVAAVGMLGATAVAPHVSPDAFLVFATAILALSLGLLAWYVDPAYTLSSGLVLSMFSGHWGEFGFPSFFAPDRFVLLVAVGAVLLRAPAVRGRVPATLGRAHVAIGVATIFVFGSALFAGTLIDGIGTFRLVDRFGLLPFAAFLVAPVAFQTARQRAVLLTTLVGIGAYLGLTALFETAGPRGLVFPQYILDSNFVTHRGRARGPFIQAAVNGMALYTCALACGVAWFAWRSYAARALALVIGVLCVTDLLFTLQRSVWLGTAVAGVVTLLAVRELRRFLVPAIVVAAALVIVSLAVIPGLSAKATERGAQAATVYDRANLNAAAFDMLQDRPLVGYGWATFEQASPDHFRLGASYPLNVGPIPVHNVFMSNLAEIGLVGTTLWLVALVLGVGVALISRGPPEARPWRIMLASVFFLWLLIANASPLLDLFPNLLLWLLAGVVSGMVAGQPDSNHQEAIP